MEKEVGKLFVILFAVALLVCVNFVAAENVTFNSLKPTSVLAGKQANFVLNISYDNSTKVQKYYWKFGDGENKSTLTNGITHTYVENGTFSLNVTVVWNNTNYSKTFEVNVKSPKNYVNDTIKLYYTYLNEVEGEISDLSGFYKESVEGILNVSETEEALNVVNESFSEAKNESDYVAVLKELEKINMPVSVYTVNEVDAAPFYPDENKIDLNAVEDAAGGSYDSGKKSQYVQKINDWIIENLDLEVTLDKIFVDYTDGEKQSLSVVEINSESKNSYSSYYIFVEDVSDLKFEEDYSEEMSGNFYYISNEDNLVFSTSDDVEVSDIPVFVSPSLSDLDVPTGENACNYNDKCETNLGESWKNCKDCNKTNLVLIILGVIFLAGLLIYIALYQWYKIKYETHLFHDRNNLFNIVNYINHAKREGSDTKEIKKNLRSAGWKSEQIQYAMRKYEGKATGMPGINPFKWFGK